LTLASNSFISHPCADILPSDTQLPCAADLQRAAYRLSTMGSRHAVDRYGQNALTDSMVFASPCHALLLCPAYQPLIIMAVFPACQHLVRRQASVPDGLRYCWRTASESPTVFVKTKAVVAWGILHRAEARIGFFIPLASILQLSFTFVQ
jgi:hypothetical protein